jgi:hypothetical protein
MLAERNLETTKWPKMDITNCRSMELLRRLGVADGLREVGKSGSEASVLSASVTLAVEGD